MTGATDLPDEVLERVFTEIRDHDNDADTKTLLSLMLSCRQFAVSSKVRLPMWFDSTTAQAVAEEVILRSVTVSSLLQMQNLETKLLKLTSYRRPRVRAGDLVRALTIFGNDHGLPDDPTANGWALKLKISTYMIFILAALPMLKSASLQNSPATRGHISHLRLANQGRLRSLDITFSFDQGQSTGVCAAINHLSHLEELKIRINPSEWFYIAYMFEPETPLQLSNVRYFDLTGPCESTDVFCDWLGRCRFHSSCSVLLWLMDPSQLSDMLRLGDFFDAHQFSAIELDVEDDVVQALATRLVSINHVRLVGAALPIQLLQTAERLPRHLVVDRTGVGDQTEAEAESMLWEFFSALPSSLKQEHKTVIQVDIAEYRQPDRLFLWADGAKMCSTAFIGQMVMEAVRLYKHGIIIQDGEGCDVKHMLDYCRSQLE
jgi:hypothetical protein